MTTDRRSFLRHLGGLALVPLVSQAGTQAPEAPAGGQGESGSLRDPASAGPSRERVTAKDNDSYIMETEKRLRCTCGCTLDIYTCRTTDFTCTYSPELHKEVLGLHAAGMSTDQIVAAFVDKYGEKVLMAPKPVGFNVAGYLVPGALLLLVAGGLFAFLRRRGQTRAVPVPGVATAAPAVAASDDELTQLAQALRDSEQ